MVNKIGAALIGGGIGLFGGFLIGSAIATDILKPKSAYIQKIDSSENPTIIRSNDLNYDRIPDMVVELVTGRRVPLYGMVNEEGDTVYVSADEMLKPIRNAADSANHARSYKVSNYKNIEKSLNGK